MANVRGLVIYSGKIGQILNADTLIVGSGVTTNSGNLTISSAGGGIGFSGVITSNITFDNNNHTITASQSAPTVPGVSMVLVAATGGIALVGSPGGAGGNLTISGGGGGAASTGTGAGGVGASVTVSGGPGGGGTATGAAGDGSLLGLYGGNSGADGGAGGANGGGVDIDGGTGTTPGALTIGVNIAASLTIGNGSAATAANGDWTFASDVTLAGNLLLTSSSPAIFPVVPGTAGAAGPAFNIFSGEGADGSGATAGGNSGTLGLFGPNGGAGTATAGAGIGGSVQLIAGGGGTDNGAGGANGGSVEVDAGSASGSSISGTVSLGASSAHAIIIGNTAASVVTDGDWSFQGGLGAPATSPTTLSGNANNYAPGQGTFQRWSASTAVNVTGMIAGYDGELRFIWNEGADNITLVNQSGSSSSGNKWTTDTGSDLIVLPADLAIAQYDLTSSTWRVALAGGGSGSGVTGSGTTHTLPVWTSSSAISDSGITDDGTTVGITARTLTWTPNGNSSVINSSGDFHLEAHVALVLESSTSGITIGSTTASTINVGNATSQTIITGAFSQGTGPMALGPSGNSTIIVSGGNLELDSSAVINIGDQFAGAVNIGRSGESVGFYGTAATPQPSTTGTTTVTSGGSGTALKADTTSTGGTGSTAYTTADVILALKQLGLLAP